MAATTKNVTNIARQPASHWMPCPKGRGDGGNEDEHGDGERHEASHLPSFVLIAHQGYDHDARPRRSDALHDAARDHHLERRERRRS